MLEQGWCGPDDDIWRSRFHTEDGTLYLWIEAETGHERPPLPFQLTLLQHTVNNWSNLKRAAVAYIRDRVVANPAEYGLELNERREDDGPDWLQAGLDDYLHDFKLRQIGVPQQGPEVQKVYLAFETHLDLENGCAVEIESSRPVREGMLADFGSMLILENELSRGPS
ncbi:hypothetical protein MF271_11120 [Deinococcus sp. KNUC1210]|uniref:hypothetical protein n=1 Tax=Deinococcus sp. KNUC1210 TaxID=2917691 RepID=UPI001EF10F31|nr:hypothetical protein [Deinococcus sp. KNUC1210]ULH14570.1 hypothetical protein MF271_11120 [Deinococcus sp. KNUC1210]